MTHEEVLKKVQDIFRDIFDDHKLIINDTTTSKDIIGWDSLAHISILGAIQDEFSITLSMKEVYKANNVGELVNLVMEGLKL